MFNTDTYAFNLEITDEQQGGLGPAIEQYLSLPITTMKYSLNSLKEFSCHFHVFSLNALHKAVAYQQFLVFKMKR